MLSFRLWLLRALLLAVILVFTLRLAYLQVGQGQSLRLRSERNHLRWLRDPAPRGMIVDRHGRVLATNLPTISIWLIAGEVPRDGWNRLQQQLVTLGIYPDASAARTALAACRATPGYVPIRLRSALTLAEVTRLEEEAASLPGVYLKGDTVRHYPERQLGAHLLGYLREIDAEELAARRTQEYRLGDRIGKAGIERACEDALRGNDGGDQVEVDALGRVMRTLRHVPPTLGRTVALTIDLDVQRAAETALQGRVGAAVALDPQTGDVLALASAPTYDVNLMSGHLSHADVARLHSTRAELNRATAGSYPPGSVFKIVTAAAALETGRVSPQQTYYCPGIYQGIHCWQHAGHGTVDLTGALAHSCNVAFMQMAERTGIDRLAAMGRRCGFGQTAGATGIMPEGRGTVPDAKWARTMQHRKWQRGETLQVGIGQAALQVTPLQAARLIAAFANGGMLVQPRWIKSIDETQQPRAMRKAIGLHASTIRQINRGLRAVAESGTARRIDSSLQVCGKTGTAENSSGLDHAWFVGFAPAEHPTIAVAVLVEHGGHGGETAVPIAETILRTALRGPEAAPPSRGDKPPVVTGMREVVTHR